MRNPKLLILLLDAALVLECFSLLHNAWLFTTSTTSKPDCSIYNDEQLHIIMDRVCEICHEMYSHQYPNTRADCRSDCFRSKHFQSCLEHFRPMIPHG
ncbi:unnamed protein product [Onchocerca flexuosa]|uniref:Crustacean CHH/MIH/GIH neurohormone family protein n=1 Tax=Onchocerca flexuosa TaxID=387005 RepID=A0A183I254_9BILA|nr:unnamed protein product [Onchocerca flexuosa]